MRVHKAAFINALLPIVFGFVGFLKLGRFDWSIAAIVAIGAAFLYYSGYQRAKYGSPPIKSLIFGDIPGRPPQR